MRTIKGLYSYGAKEKIFSTFPSTIQVYEIKMLTHRRLGGRGERLLTGLPRILLGEPLLKI